MAIIHLDTTAISNGLCEEVQTEKLKSSDVYLVFDRYKSISTKSSTRISRMAEGCKVFQLCLTAPLPSQKVTLTISQSKKQLIDIICKDLQSDTNFHQKNTEKHKTLGRALDPRTNGTWLSKLTE